MEGSTIFCQKNILEQSLSFYGEKEMPTNNKGQSNIVTHKTNTWNKVVYTTL
jgi:hypothetical protein